MPCELWEVFLMELRSGLWIVKPRHAGGAFFRVLRCSRVAHTTRLGRLGWVIDLLQEAQFRVEPYSRIPQAESRLEGFKLLIIHWPFKEPLKNPFFFSCVCTKVVIWWALILKRVWSTRSRNSFRFYWIKYFKRCDIDVVLRKPSKWKLLGS